MLRYVRQPYRWANKTENELQKKIQNARACVKNFSDHRPRIIVQFKEAYYLLGCAVLLRH
jgi:hypothetical protein